MFNEIEIEKIKEDRQFTNEEIVLIKQGAIQCLIDPNRYEELKTQLEIEDDPDSYAILKATLELTNESLIEQCA